MKASRRCRTRAGSTGQVLIETVLVLLVFLVTLIAAIDFSQILFTHQMLVERVRMGLRWGMIHEWDGSGDDVANVILYRKAEPGDKPGTPFLGLTRDNVEVTQTAGDSTNPNDLRVKVRIVNYQFRFFTPFITRSFYNDNAIVESAPILYRE